MTSITSLTELATAALADTKQRGPTLCHQCEKEPAVCTGIYEDGDEHPACDKCCGHGNEDGWCVGIKPSIREPLLAAGMLAALTANADLTRELERWKHGAQIEGDFVCLDSLALSEALRVNADLTRQLAEARAEIERLKWAALNQCDDTTLALQKLKLENYDLRRWADAPITSVEIYKGEAHRARKERDEARAALVEACRVLELRADPLWPDYDEEIARIVELKAKGCV